MTGDAGPAGQAGGRSPVFGALRRRHHRKTSGQVKTGVGGKSPAGELLQLGLQMGAGASH